jgi:phosphoglycolate phosphatase-like HAD superfamily hydrolase
MSNGTKRLALFDIDGTLITTDGLAREHFARALEDVFGTPTPAREHDFAGKMDTQIYHEILELAGIDPEMRRAKFETFSATFYRTLEPFLNEDTVNVLPGVTTLLEVLKTDDDITVGLLTGNLEQGARLKLGAVGLSGYFPFGAFGSDGMYRNELPAIAVRRAETHTGIRFREKEIVIIGDTPNDIQCGESLNVKTVAVATGKFSYETLESYEPDHLFRSLKHTDAVLSSIRK